MECVKYPYRTLVQSSAHIRVKIAYCLLVLKVGCISPKGM